MPEKREITQDQAEALDNTEPLARKELKSSIEHAHPSTAMAVAAGPEDDLEFEDPWEDEEEEEEIIVAGNSSDEEGEPKDADDVIREDEERESEETAVKVYLPGEKMEEEEVLVPDNSAYECLHSMNVEWPCLSFDILKDSLGNERRTFPLTTYIVAGSQADQPKENKLYVMKMSQLHKTKHDDGDMEDDEESDNDEDMDEDALLEHRTVPHFGGVNRIRAMPHPESHVVATWAETGKVHIFDISQHVAALNTPGVVAPRDTKPIYTNTRHRTEGYGLDWSSTCVGRLLSGDGNGKILLTQANGTTFSTEEQAFSGHKGSVEDIQWSPSERDVFVSGSVDKTIKVWDVRAGRKPQLSVVAHDSDVNVLSWNRSVDHLLASGADDGVFCIWDLRSWPSGQTPVPAAKFKWHQDAITSIEWHPHESSMLAVSGADDQITLWDLALEADEEEMTIRDGVKVPPQLLFIHQGQQHIKELHFHRQIPGLIVSTAYSGLHIFKTINS